MSPGECMVLANFMSRLVRVFMNLDNMIGKDFEAGLAKLKQLTEK